MLIDGKYASFYEKWMRQAQAIDEFVFSLDSAQTDSDTLADMMREWASLIDRANMTPRDLRRVRVKAIGRLV